MLLLLGLKKLVLFISDSIFLSKGLGNKFNLSILSSLLTCFDEDLILLDFPNFSTLLEDINLHCF